MNYSKRGYDKEREVRIALESYFGQPFVKKNLHFQGEAGQGYKEFDAVSADESIVAEVKNSQWSGSSLNGIQSDIKFLGFLEGFEIKLMILANPHTFQEFKRHDDEMRNLQQHGVELVGPDSDIFGRPGEERQADYPEHGH